MGASDGIGKSIVEFVANLTKEPAEEFGGMVADRIRFWRLKHAVRLREKTEAFLQERGITDRRAVPLKLAVAVVEGATIEDDDELHTMWAKLLANAIDPAFTEEVRYAYTEILKALSPFDARLLNEIHNDTEELSKELHRARHIVEVDLSEISRRINSKKETTLLSADCLLRQRLIYQVLRYNEGTKVLTHDMSGSPEGIHWDTQPPVVIGVQVHLVRLTELGFAFVQAVGN